MLPVRHNSEPSPEQRWASLSPLKTANSDPGQASDSEAEPTENKKAKIYIRFGKTGYDKNVQFDALHLSQRIWLQCFCCISITELKH